MTEHVPRSSQYCFVYQEWDVLRERMAPAADERYEKFVTLTNRESAFGTRMQEARINRRLTIQELAERIGVSNRTMSMYENGSEVPTEECARQIREVLGMTA